MNIKKITLKIKNETFENIDIVKFEVKDDLIKLSCTNPLGISDDLFLNVSCSYENNKLIEYFYKTKLILNIKVEGYVE